MLLMLVMAVGAASQESARPETKLGKSINRDKAASLLRTFLKSKGYDTKAAPLNIEDGADSPASGFYIFAVYVDTPQRLVTVGHYGVYGRTGDIWELVQCKRITSGAIAAKQKQIRESNGLPMTNSEQLRKSDLCF